MRETFNKLDEFCLRSWQAQLAGAVEYTDCISADG